MAARLVPYRGKVPDAIRTKIDDTIGRTMYLVQTTGPTNYVIQEQNSSVKFRVLIGAVQSCTCGDKDVCCHLLFVMLKILRVPRTNPVVWQKSLIDSEITTLLSGGYSEETSARAKPAFLRRKLAPETPEVDETTKKQVATRHALVEGEVCAICQEVMVESEKNLTYCKHGCGNNFHIDCMKVFGESRKQSKEPISCPLCRHDWGDSALTELKKEADISNRNPLVHTGTTCKQCQTKPIRCNRYRCLQCKHTDLCERCFSTIQNLFEVQDATTTPVESNAHAKHSFVLRKAHKGTWFPALRSLRDALLSPQAIHDLEGRELSHADYDLLCELDAAEKYPLQDYLMANLVGDKLGATQAKEWAPANPDVSNWCTLCTQGLRMSMDIRQLPCHHTFHESCLLQHVLAQKYHCPIEHCPHVLFPGLANEGGALAKKERKTESAASSTALPPIGLMSVVSLMKKPNGTIEPLTGIRRPPEPQTTDPARRHKAHALKPLSTSNQQENDLAGIVTASACQAPARPGTPPGHGLRKSTRVLPHMSGAFKGAIVTSDNRVEDDASSSRLRLPALGSKEPSLSPTAMRLAQAQVTRDLNRAQSQDRKRRQKIALVERKQQHAPGPSSLLPLQLGAQSTAIDETSRQERVAQATLEKQVKVKAERERKHELAKFRRQEQADRERCPLSLG